jgi:hypothetical protein
MEEEKPKKKKTQKSFAPPKKILQEKDESKVNFFSALGSFSPGEGKRGRRGGEGGEIFCTREFGFLFSLVPKDPINVQKKK